MFGGLRGQGCCDLHGERCLVAGGDKVVVIFVDRNYLDMRNGQSESERKRESEGVRERERERERERDRETEIHTER